MAIRSYICKELKDGKVRRIYCHNNGDLYRNGATLKEYYTDDNKIDKLLNLGSIFMLGHTPDLKHTIAYHRDRGGDEDVNEALIIDLPTLNKEFDIDYIYVYGVDGKWRYIGPWMHAIQLKEW